ncbi:MAG TPA: hypothetical protein VN228_09420 [Pyrinomonadaceae bacterium]|nr:hypothetical protein [Pyrinomonadaceae bacterium]
MSLVKKFEEVAAVYRRHGWRVAGVLMTGAALAEWRGAGGADLFGGVAPAEAEVDALWFTRPSQGGREAWELRLVAEPPYALFELFEPDEAEEDRADVRREMEARLREHVSPPG